MDEIDMMDGLTDTVTHLRIVHEGNAWFLDGADESGAYTRMCWTYDTWEEARDNLADFVKIAEESDGVTFAWRKGGEG